MKHKLLNKLLTLTLLILGGATLSPAWADDVLYSETFGDNGSNNTAFASYSGYSATTAMFVGSGTVTSHYTGSGKVGKNSVSVSDYSGASGLSAAWYTGTKNTTTDVLIISGINIDGYENLNLSFGINMSNGASNTNTTTVSYKIDNGDYQTLSFTHPTSSGWSVKNGSISGTGSSLTIKFTMAVTGGFTTRYDDIKVTGTSATSTYALTITEPTGGTITILDENGDEVSSGDEFEENAELTISAEASTGYTFSTWTKTAGTFSEDATEADNTFTMPAEEATIGATFTKNSYDLTLTNTNGSLAVTVDGEEWDGSSKIPYNAEVEITATPNDGYLFGEWSSVDIGDYDEVTNPLTFNMPASDVEIDASFVDASSYYSITVDDDVTGGTISADKASAAEGATITLTATPSTGYTFTSWTVKDAGDNAITVTDNQFTMPASNVTVTATFTAIAVTGVTLNKTSASISVGETETLTATVAPSNALNKAVTWTSSNTSVATVSNGTVTAVAAGSATITVTTTDGSFTATCAVTVVNAVTFDATKDTGTSLSKDGVTFATSATESSVYKWYKSSSTTFAVTNGKIKRIEFTGVSGYAISNMTASAGTLNTSDSPNGVWTGSVASVTFTASTAQARASKVKVFVATTATPTFSLAGGEYEEAKEVSISCATDGATIYYTTDGSTPTSSSTEYTGAIDITETTTLKAIAIYDGVSSSVASATYTMNRPAAPTFDVATCVFDAAFDLHLSAADGTTIYYTTDGTTPTSGSSAYSTKVAISTATTTIKAIAVKNGLTSDVASATYTYDSRITPTFSLSTTSLGLKVNDTSDAVTLTTNSDGDVTFSCADSHVTLTGTGNSRTISANAAGEYTVNVTVTNSDDYKDAAGTITVNVTKKATTMVLTPSFTSKDLYVTTSGSVTGVPQYNSSNIAGAEVTYSSSETKVATIASNGAITFRKAGTTTITVSYEGDDEYEECEASYNLDLTDSTPQSTEVSITFGNSLYGTSYTGTDAANNGPFEGTVNNVTVTVAQGSGSNLYVTNSETRIYGGTTKGTITIAAPTGYYVTKIIITKGSSWSVTASPGTLSTATWTGSASSVVFSANSRSDFQSAKVTIAEKVTVGGAGYTTYVAKHDISFPDDVTAYIAKKINAETVTLEEIDEAPLGTPVIIKANAGTYALPAITTTPDDITGNLLQASDGTVKGNGSTIYALAKKGDPAVVGFYLVNNGVTVPEGKAYLEIEGDSDVKGFTFVFEDDEDAINEVNGSGVKANGSIYDLQGRRVLNPGKGLYIVNGKKILL